MCAAAMFLDLCINQSTISSFCMCITEMDFNFYRTSEQQFAVKRRQRPKAAVINLLLYLVATKNYKQVKAGQCTYR